MSAFVMRALKVPPNSPLVSLPSIAGRRKSTLLRRWRFFCGTARRSTALRSPAWRSPAWRSTALRSPAGDCPAGPASGGQAGLGRRFQRGLERLASTQAGEELLLHEQGANVQVTPGVEGAEGRREPVPGVERDDGGRRAQDAEGELGQRELSAHAVAAASFALLGRAHELARHFAHAGEH